MKKTLIVLSGLVIIVAIIFAFNTTSAGGLLSSTEFINKYKNTPDSILVDVRTPAEYEAGHIKDAINVDFENVNFKSEVKKLDPSKIYFIYCRSGNRSGKSAVIMRESGIKNVYDLLGGVSNAPELLN